MQERPDILTVQFGLHTCVHAHQVSLIANDYTIANHSMIESHIRNIPKLMQSIRNAIERPGQNRTRQVIIVTSGSSGTSNATLVDDCILTTNRVAADEAHKHGFAVLERGEIERRLLHKSIGSKDPLLPLNMHLGQPAQSVIATVMLKLMTCLETIGYDIYSPEVPSLLNILANKEHATASAPQHTP